MKSLSFWFAGSGGLAVRRWRSSRFAALCALFICSFSLLTLAQEGTIVGTVTDPTGSVVPNATITITSIKTGQSRTLKTNESGQYVAPDLAIGEYNIQAHAPGFKIVERKNVVLNVADRARIDFAMQMGAAQETVTVEANAVRVQTDSGEVSDVITGQQVSQLTTNGRSIYTLVNLTPGASSLQQDFQVPTSAGGDAAVSGAVERHVAGRAHDAHSTDRSILRDHEIDGHFASLAQRRTGDFRYQVVPIQANIVHQAREVSAEVNAHGVAEDLRPA